MKKLIVIIIPLVSWILLFSQTVIPGGYVSGTWLISGAPYQIEGEIAIADGETLTIDPGVLVEFQGHYKFNVQGQLLAIGTEQDSIRFTINDTTGFHLPDVSDGAWDGIQFYETLATNDSSKIIYCRLEFSKTPTQEITDWNGGAIYIHDFSKLLISNCLITNNRAQSGGGICIRENSNPILRSNIIISNITNGHRSHGGGICIRNNSSPTLINNIVNNNSVRGTINYGGGIYIGRDSNPILFNNIISYNYASGLSTMGIGINIYHNSNPTLIGNIIENNYQIGYGTNGGGLSIWYHESSPILINNLITNNSSRFGGAIFCGRATPILINNTITGNTSFHGGSIYLSGIYTHSNPLIINSVLFGNSPEEIFFDEIAVNSVIITNSVIEGGQSGIITNNFSIVYWLDGNLDEDPLFIDPGEEDFHLQDISPCIGAGIDSIEINETWYFAPDIDIEGNPRPDPNDSMPDIGAYENPLGEPFVEVNDIQFSIVDFSLSNYPNPFNPSTTIEFSIRNNSHIELSIYNIKGQKIKTLAQNEFTKGSHSIIWSGEDETEKKVSSGIYLYKLIVNGTLKETRKCVLLK